MAILSPFPVWQIFDDNGVIVPGSLLYTYDAGTSTPKATYTDHTGDTAATNPIVADAAGRFSVWLGAGNYKFILTDGENAVLFDPDTVEGNTIWTRDYISGSSGGSGTGTFLVVENIEALRALEVYDNDAMVYVMGYYTRDDGGGGWFRYNSTNTDTDNYGTIIRPDSEPEEGRWLRFHVSPTVDVKWFGAGMEAQSYSFDEVYIQQAITYADSIDAGVYFPQGTYAVEFGGIMLTDKIKLTFDKNAVLTKHTSGSSIFIGESLTDVVVSGLRVKNTNNNVFEFISCNNVDIIDCISEKYDAILTSGTKFCKIAGCTNVTIKGCRSYDSQQHILITSSDGTVDGDYSEGIRIIDNTFEQNAAHIARIAYDAEERAPIAITVQYAVDVLISDNKFKNIVAEQTELDKRGYSIAEANGASDKLVISNNVFENTTADKYWTGVHITTTKNAVIESNTFYYNDDVAQLNENTFGIATLATSAADHILITGNSLKGCHIRAYAENGADLMFNIEGNTIDNSHSDGIYIENISGDSTQTVKAVVNNNTISECHYAGISINGLQHSTVIGNIIKNINNHNSAASSKWAGVVFNSSYSSIVKNNYVENITGGHAHHAIDFNDNSYLTKWVYEDNYFACGIDDVEVYGSGYTTFPSGGLWAVGDETTNALYGDTSSSKFRCIEKGSATVSGEVSSGANEIVLLTATPSINNINTGDIIGVTLSDDTIQWTTAIHKTIATTTYRIMTADNLTETVEDSAVVYFLRWRNISVVSDIFIKGVNATGERQVILNGRTITGGKVMAGETARGLTLTVLSAANLNVDYCANFDLYSSAALADTLAGVLNNATRSWIGILTSQGVWNQDYSGSPTISTALIAAAKRLGLYKLANVPTTTPYSYSYAAIFSGSGISTSNTELNRSVIEVLQDKNDNAQYAIISTTISNGAVSGQLQNAIISGDPTDSTPVACGDDTSGLLVGKRFKMRQGTTIGDGTGTISYNLDLPNDGNTFILADDGTVARINTAGWVAGSRISFYRTGDVDIAAIPTNSGTYARIETQQSVDPVHGKLSEYVLIDIDGAGDLVWVECGISYINV